jgi:hypothetical protein
MFQKDIQEEVKNILKSKKLEIKAELLGFKN